MVIVVAAVIVFLLYVKHPSTAGLSMTTKSSCPVMRLPMHIQYCITEYWRVLLFSCALNALWHSIFFTPYRPLLWVWDQSSSLGLPALGASGTCSYNHRVYNIVMPTGSCHGSKKYLMGSYNYITALHPSTIIKFLQIISAPNLFKLKFNSCLK